MTIPLAPAEIELNVRPISQHAVLTTADRADNRACWYAAALMVLDYRGPLRSLELMNIRSLLRKWRNEGVQPHDLALLAEEAGLEIAPSRSIFVRMGAVQWTAALATLGPLMVVCDNHMLVVRGVVQTGAGSAILFNDPFTGVSASKPLARFNAEVDWRRPILYRRSAHRPPVVLRQPVAEPMRVGY